jgi:hypothetical protein
MRGVRIVSEACSRGQKPFGFNAVIKKVTKRTQFSPCDYPIGVCGLEAIDSKHFLKKSGERTQFLSAARRGWHGWPARISSGLDGSRQPILRPILRLRPSPSLRIRPDTQPHAEQRAARVEACGDGSTARGLFLTAGPNASPSLEPSAPAQILFDCEIAARRPPEPARRNPHNKRNPISQYFPI